MKIMTLNAWQGRLERVLLKHLETLDIDFACMQEAVDYDGIPAGLATSYKKVAKSLCSSNEYFSALMSMRFGRKEMTFGNVIYSALPFASTNTVFTRGNYTKDFDFDKDDYNIRGFQHVEIDVQGKRLHLLNHHGHHIDSHKLGDDETLRQIQQITGYIKNLSGAIIFCGDLNLSPVSDSIAELDSIMRNLSAEYSLSTTRSNLTSKKEVCDYIFVNDQIIVNDFVMDETIVSDHNALILDFELQQ